MDPRLRGDDGPTQDEPRSSSFPRKRESRRSPLASAHMPEAGKCVPPGESESMARSSAHSLIGVGVCLTALGVVSYFQLERHSFYSTRDLQFQFLSIAFLPVLSIGSLVTLLGSAMWAWRAPILRVAVCGTALSALALLTGHLTPINIHDWTGSLMFPYATSLFVGALLLVFASVRFTLSKLALRRK